TWGGTASELKVEHSTDGVTWTAIDVSSLVSDTSNVWGLVQPVDALPLSSDLSLRFSYRRTSDYYVDDIKIVGSGGGDSEPPSVPTGLVASNVGETSVDLDWMVSTDNVGVAGYYVYTDGANPFIASGTNASVTGLSANTNYS
ncbi:fibronectin type III domain-containing protein, partial [Puniceicoccaceae bacterium K14]|nr:fibronectin type III domain-containing protein [Puniceicoccaceae bacterium K14]